MRARVWLLPLVVIGLAEAGARLSVDRVPRWYSAAEAIAARERVDVLFLGSSRVEAAVLPEAFEAEVLARGARRVRALNLGRGYTTDVEHWLGVRNLLAAQPERLRGLDVLVESPGGLALPTPWRGGLWAHVEQPWLLAEVMRPRDLRGFWRFSGLDLETRLHLGARVLLRPVSLFQRRDRLRQAQVGGDWRPHSSPPPLGSDLRGRGAGSLRLDEATLRAARELAEAWGERLLRHQRPVRSWSPSVQSALVELLRAHGGRVVFFDSPQSETFARGYRTAVRRADLRAFVDQARAWGAPRLQPEFHYDDRDLPDLWHLDGSRAEEYSRALARAWLASR